MSEKDDKVEQALDRFPDLSYDDKQQIIESMEGEQKTNITRILEKSEGIQRGILMGYLGCCLVSQLVYILRQLREEIGQVPELDFLLFSLLC